MTEANRRSDSSRLPTLQPDGAFVVHFDRSANVALGDLWGRVEHIVSGAAGHFTSAPELFAFIAGVLRTTDSAATNLRNETSRGEKR